MSKLPLRDRQIRAALVVVLSGVVAAVVIGVGRSGASAAPPGFSSVSNQGAEPLALDLKAESLVRAAISKGVEVTPVRPMGTLRGTTFYRVGTSGCYGSGPSLGVERLTALFCTENFPSIEQPIVVDIVKKGSPDHQAAVAWVQGIGADAIAAVTLLDAAGNVVTKAAVVRNLFRIDAVPTTAVTFVALDATGNVLQRINLP